VQPSTFNILMYSHDTYGLGHIRRTMAIAAHLRAEDVNTLILTGSPIAGRFSFPERVDFVRIPGMIKKTNDQYLPLAIHIDPRQALDIRKRIILATAKAFRPALFIVDKEPLGLKQEVLPTLQWMRRATPATRTVLGLRDILDDAPTVRADWQKKKIYAALEKLYDEIWIYGVREFYDPVSEYAFPPAIEGRVHFTGYIPRRMPGRSARLRIRRELSAADGEKLVVVTAGGGGDGFAMMDCFLDLLESAGAPAPFRSVMVSGPFMAEGQRSLLQARARRLGVRFFHFHRHMERLIAAADLVVGMGGYNTLCEILSQKTLALLVPRETPRREQLVRAETLARQRLVDYLPGSALTPTRLQAKIDRLLADPQPYREAMARFELTGLQRMNARLQEFRCPPH
jgi:predicted glycosyltransferase